MGSMSPEWFHLKRNGRVSGRLFCRRTPDAGGALQAGPPQSRRRFCEDIEDLADKCETSLTATAIRYAQFADDPVAIFMSDGQKVDYCFMSDSLFDCIPRDARYQKGKLVPPSSPTGRFNQDAANVREARRAEGVSTLADWFDGAPEVEVQEDVVGACQGTTGER